MHDFGRYQVLEELPCEWLTNVCRAVERTTGAEVKIYHWELPLPVLSPRERRAQDKINELLRAATCLSRLSHPGIARIFGSGESDGWFYLATEMIEGAALKFIMGALDAAVSLDMLRQTAAALDYAHAMGVLHLALEPAKMVVDDAGRLRLTGFGEGAITSWIYDVMPELILLPVSYYWAPEQFTNRRCDAMADQFSLAAIAFHMLTGQSPFHPADNVSDFHRIFEGKYPAAHEVNPEVPPAVSVTLRRGLASQPGDRFGSCGELVSALEIALRRKRPG